MKRLSVGLILLLAFCGIAVSAYLAQSEAMGAPLICNIQNLSGCNVVVESQYSKILGISLADFGLLFYTMLFVVAAFELILLNQILRHTLQGFALIGLLSSGYSVFTQYYLIQAWCIYCLTSVLITVLVFMLATTIEPVWPHLKRLITSRTT